MMKLETQLKHSPLTIQNSARGGRQLFVAAQDQGKSSEAEKGCGGGFWNECGIDTITEISTIKSNSIIDVSIGANSQDCKSIKIRSDTWLCCPITCCDPRLSCPPRLV